MTAPTGSDHEDTSPSPAVGVLDVVSYKHVDPILGGSSPEVGVVVAVGDVLQVLPLGRYRIQVDPAAVRVLTAELLAADEG